MLKAGFGWKEGRTTQQSCSVTALHMSTKIGSTLEDSPVREKNGQLPWFLTKLTVFHQIRQPLHISSDRVKGNVHLYESSKSYLVHSTDKNIIHAIDYLITFTNALPIFSQLLAVTTKDLWNIFPSILHHFDISPFKPDHWAGIWPNS